MTPDVSETHVFSNSEFAGLMAAVLEKGLPFRFEASGHSMSPFIRDQDLLTIAPVQTPVRRGDILAAVSSVNGRLVVHRVVGCGAKAYLLKGDANRADDGWVPGVMILGRVVKIERGRRQVRAALGPCRFVIALLSRTGLLPVLLAAARALLRALRRHGVRLPSS